MCVRAAFAAFPLKTECGTIMTTHEGLTCRPPNLGVPRTPEASRLPLPTIDWNAVMKKVWAAIDTSMFIAIVSMCFDVTDECID